MSKTIKYRDRKVLDIGRYGPTHSSWNYRAATFVVYNDDDGGFGLENKKGHLRDTTSSVQVETMTSKLIRLCALLWLYTWPIFKNSYIPFS